VRLTLDGDGALVLGERFSTFVAPDRPIGAAITRLTGITDADLVGAPAAADAAARFAEFARGAWLVGHNVAFDLAFLERSGYPPGARWLDSADVASIVLPGAPSYALQRLAADAAIDPGSAHRALDDALTCASVLRDLTLRARSIAPLALEECAATASLIGEPAAAFFRGLVKMRFAGDGGGAAVHRAAGGGEVEGSRLVSSAKAGGDPPATRGQSDGSGGEPLPSARDGARPEVTSPPPAAEAFAALATTLEGYEDRPQQRELAEAIERIFESGGALVAEAGTGVGKSMAYLVPALARAIGGERVIVSTHALPLQDQLVRKDLPALQAALGTGVSVALLKGRGNYLCPRRWQIFRGQVATREEARLLLKTLVWRTTTTTGDRAELNLLGGEGELWPRISADDETCTSRRCAGTRGGCYLEGARQAAAKARIVVANHALLLHDARAGNTILPEAEHVVVDEAHRLEDVAADAFGFKLEDRRLRRDLERIARSPLVVASLRTGSSAGETPPSSGATPDPMRVAAAEMLRAEVARAHETGAETFAALQELLAGGSEEGSGPRDRLRLTDALRRDEGRWLPVEVAAERLADACAGVRRAGERLEALATFEEEDAATELESALKELIGTQGAIAHGIHDPRRGEVAWLERRGPPGGTEATSIGMYVAPAHVGGAVRRTLVDKHRSVVFTSATLAVAGSLAFAMERFGVSDVADGLLVGSPFDYASQASLLVPSDGVLPDDPDYAAECADAITEIGRALSGRTLVLFTSHAAMRDVSARLEGLESSNVAVLTQGVDGSRRAILERFAQGGAVLLGTQSFWEGVDLPGDLLRCVVVTRLPFDVPDDPLVQGRSERYDDPFREYHLPQAALRLRQGVGRLIRTRTDRGAIVLLDRRIVTKEYGPTLLASLPPARLQRVPHEALAALVAEWCAR